jgi:glycosyltransferase involved in cell wall biosynthesis
MKPTLVVVGPLPPPYHGVTISTSLVLANPNLHEFFDVRHVDTSDPRSGENIGRWDWTNVAIATRALIRLWRETPGRKGLVYLPLSQSSAGFIRDSLLIQIAARRGWKVAGHLRGGEFRSFYEASPWLFRIWTRATLRRITSIAVMGESLRSLFEGLVPRRRTAVVPNGSPEPAVDVAVRDDTTILFLSNLRCRKGIVEAVEAARLVTREHDRARFLFVGAWEGEGLARDLRERAAVANGRIQFMDPVVGTDKDRLLSSVGIVLFPPIEPEGHPRVVLEALATGTPVVTTDRGAIAETIVDGQTGFVLPNPDPTALADRILLLLRDADLRRRMGNAARARYLERFTQPQADRVLAEWLSAVFSEGHTETSQ